MTPGDDEGPKDWEIEDEEPPESLRRKWEEEEGAEKKRIVCPSCKKETPSENLACIFCGTYLDLKNKGDKCRPNYPNEKEMESLGGTALLQESGLISGFWVWVKRLFKKG